MSNQPPTPPAETELLGYDAEGRMFSHRLTPAESLEDAEAGVRQVGGRVIFARLLKPHADRPRGISAEDFARFNEMLADCVHRGVPMLDGIRLLAHDIARPAFTRSLDQVRARLKEGASLQDAFSPESAGFPAIYGRLLQAGVAAGNLEEVLLILSRNIRVNALFRRSVVEVMAYPALLLVVIMGFMVGIGALVFPRYDRAAEALQSGLPSLTVLIFGSGPGEFAIRAAFALILLSGIAFCLLLHWGGYWTRSVNDGLLRRIPVVKRFYEASVWANIADTLRLLIRAQVPAPLALRLTGEAVAIPRIRRALDSVAAAVEKGIPASDAARNCPDIPYRFAFSLESGASAQNLSDSMKSLAEEYRTDGERRAQTFIRYAPAAFGLALGIVVMAIAIGVFGVYMHFWEAKW